MAIRQISRIKGDKMKDSYSAAKQAGECQPDAVLQVTIAYNGDIVIDYRINDTDLHTVVSQKKALEWIKTVV